MLRAFPAADRPVCSRSGTSRKRRGYGRIPAPLNLVLALLLPGLVPGLVSSLILSLVLTLGWPSPALALDATFDPTSAVIVPQSSSGVPIGTIIAWPVSQDPSDAAAWLDCDGRTIQATDYPGLVAVLSGSATATRVRLPDLRGLFLRGHGSRTHLQNNGENVGVTATTHQSGQLGQVQGDAIRNIYGTLTCGERIPGGEWINDSLTGAFGWYGPSNADGLGQSDGDNVHSFFSASRVVPTGPENRPVNMAVRYLIRAL